MRVLIVLVAGCESVGAWDIPGEPEAAPTTERLVVSPGTLDFGEVSVNDQGWAGGAFSVMNLGTETVTISGHDEPAGSLAFEVESEPLLTLAPGGVAEIGVRFTPSTDEEAVATLTLSPGGETLTLRGRGRAPVIEVGTPAANAVVLGCEGNLQVPVTNAGSEPLLLSEVASDNEEYVPAALPAAIAPGATAYLDVVFTPERGDLRAGVLTLATNDPVVPVATVPLTASGVDGNLLSDSFVFFPANPTDFLFLVESNDETAEELPRGAAAAQTFVDAVRAANIDEQIAVLDGTGACSSPAFVTRSDPEADALALLQAGFAGQPGAWDQDLLGLARASLDQDGCLASFHREDAELHLVVVADGPAAYDLVDEVVLLKELAPELRVSGLTPGSSACGVPSPDYVALSGATGGRVEDLCAADWGDAFGAIARVSEREPEVRFSLTEEPIASSLVVAVDGEPWTQWYYDPVQNDVVFGGADRPALGAGVEVGYVPAGVCGG